VPILAWHAQIMAATHTGGSQDLLATRLNLVIFYTFFIRQLSDQFHLRACRGTPPEFRSGKGGSCSLMPDELARLKVRSGGASKRGFSILHLLWDPGIELRFFRDIFYFRGISQIHPDIEIDRNSTNDPQLFRDYCSSNMELVQNMHV